MKTYRIWFRGDEEKTIPEWQEEARRTRRERMDRAFRKEIRKEQVAPYQLNTWFAKLWFGEDLDEVNAALTEYLRKEEKNHRPSLCWGVIDAHLPVSSLYFCFGREGSIAPGRLYPETEKALLSYLWEMTRLSNDVHLAKESVWYVSDSENLDIGHKIGSLLTSLIFSREPDYCGRVYPNPGRGFALNEYPFGERQEKRIFEEYHPKEQYAAWVEFFHRYFEERARKGFFIERGAHGYMQWTLDSIMGLYAFAEDEGLKKKVRMFLDLVWTDWVQEEINGIRGGIKTRHHYSAGENGKDAMKTMAVYFLGGPGEASLNYKIMMLSGYEFPDYIWKMALDRESLGCYTYLSRGITEENPVLPRPAGWDCTMLADVESRCVRVSYVTPDYVLASPQEHPRMIYNHLATAGRIMGLITGSDTQARIVPVALDPSPRLSPAGERYHTDLVCNAVQDRNVVIFQQKRRFMQANPVMFPAYDDGYNQQVGIVLGNGWDEVLHRNGVLYLKKDNVYASLRIIYCLNDDDPLAWAKGTAQYADRVVTVEDPYTWEEYPSLIRLKSPFSPVILEASSERECGSFEAFVESIEKNVPDMWATQVKREAGVVIRYRGIRQDAAELVYNAANNDVIPTVNGKSVDYRYPYTFRSPYVSSVYDSGVVTVSLEGENITYDFRNDTVAVTA